MADKVAIELGLKLYRLMGSDDFAPFLAELDSRIANCELQLKVSGSTINTPTHYSAYIAQRLDALTSLREWLDDEIERGGSEKMKQEAIDAKVAA